MHQHRILISPKVKISVPCSDEFISNYKGKWLIHDSKLSPISVSDYHDDGDETPACNK